MMRDNVCFKPGKSLSSRENSCSVPGSFRHKPESFWHSGQSFRLGRRVFIISCEIFIMTIEISGISFLLSVCCPIVPATSRRQENSLAPTTFSYPAFDCGSFSICEPKRVKAPKSKLISYSVSSSTPVSFGIIAVMVPKAFFAFNSGTPCCQRT